MSVYRREPDRILMGLFFFLHILGLCLVNSFEVRAVGGKREGDISKKQLDFRVVQASHWFSQ